MIVGKIGEEEPRIQHNLEPSLAEAIVSICESTAGFDDDIPLKSTIEGFLQNTHQEIEIHALEHHAQMSSANFKEELNRNNDQLDPYLYLKNFDEPIDRQHLEQLKNLKRQLHPDDNARAKEWFIQTKKNNSSNKTTLLRVYSEQRQVFELYLVHYSHQAFIIYAMSNALTNDIETMLIESFQLSHSELIIVRGLLCGSTLADLAKQTGKSIETIRSQFKSLSYKVGASRQQDVVNIVHNVAAIGQKVNSSETKNKQEGSFVLNDGRTLSYDVIGDLEGTPYVFVHDYSAGRHWPNSAKRLFKEKSICLITISRAGFGASSSVDQTGLDLIDSHINDILSVLKHEKWNKFNILTFGTGFAIAYRFALKHPKKIEKIIGVDIYPPITRHRHAMQFPGGFYRSAMLAALHAPKTHVFLSKILAKYAKAINSPQELEKLLDLKLFAGHDEPEKFFNDVLKPNLDDLGAVNFEGSWRDCTFVTKDWTKSDNAGVPLSNITLVHHHDFPSMNKEFVKRFADKFELKFIEIEDDFMFQYDQMKPILHLL